VAQTSNYRWAVLFASFFAFVAFAFVFQLMPSLVDFVKRDFAINDTEFGLLSTVVMVPGIFIALPFGLVVNKYGFRTLGFLSTILAALGGLITALSPTYTIAILGRVILGIGGAFIIVGTPTLIPQWFPHKESGKAMGVFSANMPVATIIAFPTALILADAYGWRSAFYVGSVAAVIAAVIFLVLVKEGPLKGQQLTAVQWKDAMQAIRTAEVWKASVIWMLFNATAIAFLTFAPTLFETFKGLEPLDARILASVLMYAAAVLVPVFGWVSDKSGKRKSFMIVGGVMLGLALNAASYATGFSLILSVTVLGIAAAMVPPLVMAVTADSLPPHLAGTGFSIVTFCQNIGIAASGPVAGYILQTTGRLDSTFLGISVFSFAAAATALRLKSK